MQHMARLIMELYLAKLGTCNKNTLVSYFLLYFIMNYAYSLFYPIHSKYSETPRAQRRCKLISIIKIESLIISIVVVGVKWQYPPEVNY